MPWRDAQELHIYAPAHDLYGNNWVEQILGTIVRPLYEQFSDAIRWMWVTRYSNMYDNNAPPQGYPIPDLFLVNGRYRYILFRISAESQFQQEIQAQAIQRATDSGCFTNPRRWIDYDVVADLGSNRFIKASATEDERANRAKLIAYYIDGTIKLMLDSLAVDREGRWGLEENQSEQNPHGSIFESIHHLFCNATRVPTTVIVASPVDQVIIRTHWMERSPDHLKILKPGIEEDIRINY